MESIKSIFTKNLPTLCIILSFSLYNIFYIYSIHVNVLWQASFLHLHLLDRFFSNNLQLSDLLVPFGEHGLFGYNLLFIFNAIFFKLNTIVDAYAIWISIIVSTLFISFEFNISTKFYHKSILNQLLFIPIAFILFNLTQGNGQGMDVQVRTGVALTIPTIFFTNMMLKAYDNLSIKLFAYLFAILSTLVFGTAYSLSIIPTLFITHTIQYFNNRKISISSIRILLFIFLCGILYLYIFIYLPNNNHPHPNSLSIKIKNVFFDPINSLKFILAAISSSTYGSNAYVHYLHSQKLLLINGFGLFICYVYSLREYFINKMWKTTYMPISLIMITLTIILLVLIGRNSGNSWDWPTSTWYITHYKYGLAGIVWILTHSIYTNIKKINITNIIKSKPLNLTMILYIIIGLITANMFEVKFAKNIKNYFSMIVPYAYVSPGQMPVDANGYTPFANKYETTLEGLAIMKKYNLNVYHDIRLPASPSR